MHPMIRALFWQLFFLVVLLVVLSNRTLRLVQQAWAKRLRLQLISRSLSNGSPSGAKSTLRTAKNRIRRVTKLQFCSYLKHTLHFDFSNFIHWRAMSLPFGQCPGVIHSTSTFDQANAHLSQKTHRLIGESTHGRPTYIKSIQLDTEEHTGQIHGKWMADLHTVHADSNNTAENVVNNYMKAFLAFNKKPRQRAASEQLMGILSSAKRCGCWASTAPKLRNLRGYLMRQDRARQSASRLQVTSSQPHVSCLIQSPSLAHLELV